MKDQGEDNRGTGKKFLYTGAKPKDSHPSQAWDTFAPKKKPHSDFDLDDVWSIKRNVTIGNPATSSTLNKTATTGTNTNSYYSRHSNVKFGDDINSSLGVSSGLSAPGTFRTGGRTQKSNRTTGSSWMDF
ncbi:uncharacterized protein LOC144432930 isoform X2 [Glandiceps talaboti]